MHTCALLPTFLTKLNIVSPESIIAIDFSAFGKWQVLMFAMQTRRGRAIPVYFEIITYPIEKDSQNIFIVSAIENFVALMGCRPLLVFDRGFACPYIIRHLAQQSHPFIIRIKSAKKFVDEQDAVFKARDASGDDVIVTGYGIELRLVTSDDPGNGNDPWYLITQDTESSRQTIIDRYYYRFEIEEFFKDAKWLQGLEHTRFKKIESVTTLLWFVLIGWWCCGLLSEKVSDVVVSHAHDRVSFIRRVFEAMQRERFRLAMATMEAVPSPYYDSPASAVLAGGEGHSHG